MQDPDRPTRIDALAAELVGSGVLGNYVIIAEVVDSDNVDLRVVVSGGLSPWAAKGMVMTAQEVLYNQDADEEGPE